MHSPTAIQKILRNKRHLSALTFVVVVVGYFASEALLRRKMYMTPAGDAAGKQEIIKRLPDFLQNYFKRKQEIADAESGLEKATDPDERMKLMFSLSGLVSQAKSRKLMQQIVDENPNSPDCAPALAIVLRDMDEEEAFREYTAYVERCDIRTAKDKVAVWQTGLGLLTNASKKTRMAYVRKMADAHVVADNLVGVYEELWVLALTEDNKELATKAKELQAICSEELVKTQAKARR